MYRTITISLALIALVAAHPARAGEPLVLSGHWVSAVTEAQGKLFVTRDFTFEDDSWHVIYRAFADAEAKLPLFTLDVGGVFVIGGPSAAVPGAHEGIFPATHRKITASSGAGVAMFAAMGCALKVGEVKELISEPCGFVPSQMQAMGEYDLVKIENGRLFFGDRSGDLTKDRPNALYPFPLVQK